MYYYEVVSQDGHTRRTQLVYGDTPEGAIRTARAYGLVGKIIEVRRLMLVSVWIPPEAMPKPQPRLYRTEAEEREYREAKERYGLKDSTR